jgi:tetratricopeptide (TPR) repeat protein
MPRAGKGSWGRIVPLAAALVLAAIAFWPGLWAGFVYDDRRDVLLNPAARAEGFLSALPATVRPLLKASYALQDWLTGMNPVAFHAANLALHLASMAAAFALVRRACLQAGCGLPLAQRIAGMTLLLWALHPALTETVTYVSGRSVGLSSLLVLLCLLAATADRPRPWAAFLMAGLAPLARETALITPLLLLAWQITLAHEAPRRALCRAAPVWAGAILAALILAAMARHRDLVAFSLDQRGPLESLRANLFAIPEILRLWLQPWRISVLPAQPVLQGWTDPPTLFRLGAIAALPAAALVLRRRAPLLAFAVLWTGLALAPTNSLIWRVDPVALRPLYLAGIGLSLALALALARVRPGLWLAAGLALWLATQTAGRATLYQDEVALFADAAARSPQDARAQLMLGLVLANAGRLDEARQAIKTAIVIDPFLTGAENALRLLDAGVHPAP